MSFVATLLGTLIARDPCRYIEAKPGDSCYDLAQRCGITQSALTSNNPAPFSCSKIEPGDYVCCSTGSRPEISSQQRGDGICVNQTVKPGDTCSSIASHSPDDSDNLSSGSDGYPFGTWELCDYTRTWPSLDQLNVDAPYLRRDCLDVYTLQVLMTTLDAAYENYTRVDNGYDEMFEYYTKYMKKLVPKAVAKEFMFNDSTKATAHHNPPTLGYGMDYFDCELGDGTVIPCSKFDDDKYIEIEAKKTTALTLRDHEGYVAGLAKAGLDPDWVEFGHYHTHVDVTAFRYARTYRYKFTGFPVENSTMVVPNPKDLVVKGLRNIPELQKSMAATYTDMVLGQWFNGSTGDAAQAYSAPVLMLMQGIDSMQQAKTLGEKEKKEEEEEEKRKKDFILLLVSMVLMFVPVLGEELAVAAGLATLAKAIALAGEAGNAALAIYDTVDDPKSAVVNILGMLLGVGAIARVSRDGKGIGEVARIRRGMKAEQIESMGAIFKNNDHTLQLIAKSCKLK